LIGTTIEAERAVGADHHGAHGRIGQAQRAAQERACAKRGEQNLLIKSQQAPGPSRALIFIVMAAARRPWHQHRSTP
jgi:hypothetical protein